MQFEEHELTRVEPEALLAQGMVDGAAEGHELRLNAGKLRKRAHGEEHLLEKAAADIGLREPGRNVEAADEAFLFFENIEKIAGGRTILESNATAESVSFEKAFDEIESAAIVPVQLVVPVASFFFEEGLELADTGLAKVENIHG